jgi:hypothetical protein
MLEYINGWVSETFDICLYYEWNNWKYRHKWLTISGKKGCCSINIVHRGIPNGGACPPAGGAHGGGGQYPWLEGGGRGGCWNSGLDGRLEVVAASIHLKAVAASIHLEAAVAATSEAARLRETLPTASRVVGPYENPITWKFDSLMSKNLSSELKKEESYNLWSIEA